MFSLTPFNYRSNNNIFKAFDEMEKSFLKNFWDTDFSGFKTDIIDSGDSFRLDAELPGFSKEDISIDISDKLLTISAQHKEEKEEKDQKGNYIKKERSYGSYSRSFDISNIKTDEISAEYKNGILELTLPKLEDVQPEQKKIEIK
ncbi:MAG: Hsp20/alpha crystallin family protein [Oscillospiraceae bacterium]|jgi:HSP20 family protein